jgi:hypothetical protein
VRGAGEGPHPPPEAIIAVYRGASAGGQATPPAQGATAAAGLGVPRRRQRRLRALLGRRQQLIGTRTAAQNRLAGTSGRLPQDIEAHIAWRKARLATLDDDLETRLRASPLWRENNDLLQSVPDMAAGTPRVVDAHAAANRGLGRRGPPPLCQGDPAGPAHHLGRSRACAHRVIHGHARGDTV